MPQSRILLGVIGRPHGVRGQVRVTSYADPPEAIAAYGPLSDETGRRFSLHWLGDGVVTVAEIVDGRPVKVTDRGAAERLTNMRLYIDRVQLPQPEAEEYYFADLVGLCAEDATGHVIGTVAAVHDYGAGASLEIVRPGAPPLLVPFTRAAVPEVDIAAGRVMVAPPAEINAPPPSPAKQARADADRDNAA